MSTASAAFSVRFVRNGDQLIVTRDIIDSNGNGSALFQVVNKETYAPVPDWTVAANQPIIRVGVRSAAGFPVVISGVVWKYNGTALTFPTLTSTFQTSTSNDSFQARIYTDSQTGKQYYDLKIVKNLVGSGVIANKQITYDVSYASNGLNDTIEGSVDVLIQAGGDTGYNLVITTPRVELDTTNTNTTLTANAYFGTSAVTIGSGGYTVKWYKDGVEISGQTGATLTVDRDMVTGGNIFVCKLFKDNAVKAQDSQRINDIADEYQIVHTIKTGAGYSGNTGYLAPGQSASWGLSITKNGSTYAGAVSYAWKVYNSLGVQTGSGTGDVITVTPLMAVVGEGEGAYYSDVDVSVEATF